MRAVAGGSGDAAVEVEVAAVVAEAAAAGATRGRTGLRVAGRWTIRIFRRAGPCSCLPRATVAEGGGPDDDANAGGGGGGRGGAGRASLRG